MKLTSKRPFGLAERAFFMGAVKFSDTHQRLCGAWEVWFFERNRGFAILRQKLTSKRPFGLAERAFFMGGVKFSDTLLRLWGV
jgi:hypothetical protein